MLQRDLERHMRIELKNGTRSTKPKLEKRSVVRSRVGDNSDNEKEQYTVIKRLKVQVVEDVEEDEYPDEEKIHGCDLCLKKFSRTEQLDKHKDLIHHKCNLCGKMMRKQKVDEHKVQAHKCRQCDEMFVTQKEKKIHRATHLKATTQVCTICGVNLRGTSTMSRHMLVHADVQPLKCEICHKGFSTNYTLKYHMTLHTGEMNYQCDICRKNFRRPEQLRTHYRLHTGERPYKCNICGKDFHLSGEYNKHMKRIHGVFKNAQRKPNQGLTSVKEDMEDSSDNSVENEDPTIFITYR